MTPLQTSIGWESMSCEATSSFWALSRANQPASGFHLAGAYAALLRIEDVNEFDGHIACDSASLSELVVPLISGGTLLGVLDVDSPDFGRFSETDQYGIEKLCTTFVEQLERRKTNKAEFI
jgi:GAF domain-containing protein